MGESAGKTGSGSREALAEVVRVEIQRAAIDIMRNRPGDFDLIVDYPYLTPAGAVEFQPVNDLPALGAAQPEVRFLQQAFEWEHLSWIL